MTAAQRAEFRRMVSPVLIEGVHALARVADPGERELESADLLPDALLEDADELLSALEDDNVFAVGDEFQAIYGFRHADVEIFRERRAAVGPEGHRRLTANFRSAPELLASLNAAFGPVLGPAFSPLVPGGVPDELRLFDPGAGAADPPLELLVTAAKGWDAHEAALGLDLPGSSPERRAEVVSVSESEIADAWLELASREGVFCEPASAAGLAGLAHLALEPGSTVVCVLTGHGLKDTAAVDVLETPAPAVVEPTVEAILAEADPIPGRRTLEIGPGLGFLTRGLLDAGAAVTAVELDRGLAAFLRERFATELERAAAADPDTPGGLRLIEGDALDQDLVGLLEPPYDVVANLPYHITSPILHALLGEPPRPERLVLMVQREVAERIAAAPGRMSYLSVFVQYHAKVRVAFRVPPTAFEPEPAVDSAVIVVEPYAADDRLGADDEAQLWRLVQAAFRERRKMLHNVLARQLPVDAGRVDAALAEAGMTTCPKVWRNGLRHWASE